MKCICNINSVSIINLGETAVIEIKCPINDRNYTIIQPPPLFFFFFAEDDYGILHLKQNHDY